MNESTNGTAACENFPQAACKPKALATVGEASAEQVVLSRQKGPLAIEIHAVKGDGIEIIGSSFFPKNTHLEFELLATEESEDAPEVEGVTLRGVVAKIQMVNTAPTYNMWVQLEDVDPTILHGLWMQCRAGEATTLQTHPSYAADCASMPNWVARLVAEGVFTKAQFENLSDNQEEHATPLDVALIQAGLAREEEIARSVGMELSVPYVDVYGFNICTDNHALIPLDIARQHRLFPLFSLDRVLTLGMSDPTNLEVIDQVRLQTNCQVEPCHLTPSAITALIDDASKGLGAEALEDQDDNNPEFDSGAEDANTSNPTVRLVRAIVEESAGIGASDIHIEPEHNQVRIRMRVDGVLREKSIHPQQQHASIVSRIKVMAKLDIAETRRPQDGHFTMKLANGKADIRVSTIPTVYGENVVLRLLISDGQVLGLEDLGMAPETYTKMEEFLENPHGMILVTGPTGSGKTTTLYAALARLGTPERNVVTVEDPVEKRIAFLRQTAVNPKAGVTFATGLRSILRQDPDVIMIGEIRDREAAELAVQAALTGHLVLSTLHTNDASGAIVRLNEMGIAPFLITSSLRAVVSQRLARKVCSECAEEVEPDPKLLEGLGFTDYEGVRFLAGSGCGACLNSGYKGRVGLYEMLELNSALRAALLGKASRSAIEVEAEKALLCSLRSDGLRRVREGVTTLDEIARIVGLQRNTKPTVVEE